MEFLRQMSEVHIEVAVTGRIRFRYDSEMFVRWDNIPAKINRSNGMARHRADATQMKFGTSTGLYVRAIRDGRMAESSCVLYRSRRFTHRRSPKVTARRYAT
jgi:hypothetical protein